MVLAPDWYAEMAGEPLAPIGRALDDAYPAWLLRLAARVPFLRGILGFRLAGGADGIAVIGGEHGTATVLVLEAWLRRRRGVVVLESIPREPDRRLSRGLFGIWRRLLLHPAMRRALAGAQVLSEHERELQARSTGVPLERFHLVPWPLSSGEAAEPAGDSGVFSSGRAFCDWETLFAAARGRGWELTIVCGAHDRALVDTLNESGEATVHSHIPLAEHDALLRSAAVFAMPLRAGTRSAGHVRLMSATDARMPVVASDVPALSGYAVDGETAVLVPAGDAPALREAVERLLADPAERMRLAGNAAARAREWTYREYFAEIRSLITRAFPAAR